jgi:hypothetical protein
MASVLKIKMQMNQVRCLLPPALHRATPFQGSVQRTSKIITNVPHIVVDQRFANSIYSSFNPHIKVPCQFLNSDLLLFLKKASNLAIPFWNSLSGIRS